MAMAQARKATRTGRTQAGIALMTLGFLLLFGKLGLIAAQVPGLLASLKIEALGVPAALSLSLLRLFRTIAFHPAALFPLVCGILVLSFALVGILSGLILVRKGSVETAR
jgi:hypothetical protein